MSNEGEAFELNEDWVGRVNNLLEEREAEREAQEANEPQNAGLAEYLNEPAIKAPERVKEKNWERLDKNGPLGNYNPNDEFEIWISCQITDLWDIMSRSPVDSTFEDEVQRQRVGLATNIQVTRGRNGFERKMLNTKIGENVDNTPAPSSSGKSVWQRLGL